MELWKHCNYLFMVLWRNRITKLVFFQMWCSWICFIIFSIFIPKWDYFIIFVPNVFSTYVSLDPFRNNQIQYRTLIFLQAFLEGQEMFDFIRNLKRLKNIINIIHFFDCVKRSVNGILIIALETVFLWNFHQYDKDVTDFHHSSDMTTGSNLIFLLNKSFIEEGYMLYNITPW